ncbi:MAG: cell division protein FtsQ/DivIB [Gammaproteobacteria bacterium]
MKRYTTWLLAAVFVAGLMTEGGDDIREFFIDLLPVRYVRVGGVFQYIEKDEIKKALLPVVSTGFISADIQEIRDSVESMAWVDRAEVKRIWPDTLDIRIYEQRPAARWGSDALLNERGERFNPARLEGFEELPLIWGPEGKQKSLFKLAKQMNRELGAQDFLLAELNVSERRSWRITLGNGMAMQLGRKEPLTRFQRFLRVAPVLGKGKVEKIEKMDMRYPNGFTVTWKPGEEPEWKDEDKQSGNGVQG